MSTAFPNDYAHLYADPKGPGDARPTALQIIKDNDLVHKWSGKVCLVTGATSSIGLETVRALHATDADVYFTARDDKKGQAAIDDIRKNSEVKGSGKLEYIIMEGQKLDSVRAAAEEFLKRSDRLNILINNAGKLLTDSESFPLTLC